MLVTFDLGVFSKDYRNLSLFFRLDSNGLSKLWVFYK